ncbi:hypothetical protein SADUNF_Sadunf19G0025700 [Salix dunnii]|uniref:Uncharacterized protein n=1 Tax=Salix dunnii TaxID=1413687 RepID=A0A835J1F6_9ROSI|nr:hypothetical protein SADUNF_Sadunf19G0025700 [Salix dunnii]
MSFNGGEICPIEYSFKLFLNFNPNNDLKSLETSLGENQLTLMEINEDDLQSNTIKGEDHLQSNGEGNPALSPIAAKLQEANYDRVRDVIAAVAALERAIRRDLVQPLCDKKDEAKLAVLEATLVGPKFPVKPSPFASTSFSAAMDTTATTTTIETQMGVERGAGDEDEKSDNEDLAEADEEEFDLDLARKLLDVAIAATWIYILMKNKENIIDDHLHL